MSLVKSRDNRTGITYVYESESYWDKEKKQPRAKRKLIGKLDEATGEIVPTDGRRRKRKSPEKETDTVVKHVADDLPDYEEQIRQKDIRIAQLTEENQQIKARLRELLSELADIQQRYISHEP